MARSCRGIGPSGKSHLVSVLCAVVRAWILKSRASFDCEQGHEFQCRAPINDDQLVAPSVAGSFNFPGISRISFERPNHSADRKFSSIANFAVTKRRTAFQTVAHFDTHTQWLTQRSKKPPAGIEFNVLCCQFLHSPKQLLGVNFQQHLA